MEISELARPYIGSSDIVTLMGYHMDSTAEQVLDRIRYGNERSGVEENFHMRRGRFLEQGVLDWYRAIQGLEKGPEYGQLVSPNGPYTAQIDGSSLVMNGDVIIHEVKIPDGRWFPGEMEATPKISHILQQVWALAIVRENNIPFSHGQIITYRAGHDDEPWDFNIYLSSDWDPQVAAMRAFADDWWQSVVLDGCEPWMATCDPSGEWEDRDAVGELTPEAQHLAERIMRLSEGNRKADEEVRRLKGMFGNTVEKGFRRYAGGGFTATQVVKQPTPGLDQELLVKALVNNVEGITHKDIEKILAEATTAKTKPSAYWLFKKESNK